MTMSPSVVCSYCARRTEKLFYEYVLWKSYRMCPSCKNNLKSCISCEKKIKKDIDPLISLCCGMINNNLCEECNQLSIICCDQKFSNIVTTILYYMDIYLGITISDNFQTLQNIYTFNKISYNEINHHCTFQYNYVKFAKVGKMISLRSIQGECKDNGKESTGEKTRSGTPTVTQPTTKPPTQPPTQPDDNLEPHLREKEKRKTNATYLEEKEKRKKNGTIKTFIQEFNILKKGERRKRKNKEKTCTHMVISRKSEQNEDSLFSTWRYMHKNKLETKGGDVVGMPTGREDNFGSREMDSSTKSAGKGRHTDSPNDKVGRNFSMSEGRNDRNTTTPSNGMHKRYVKRERSKSPFYKSPNLYSRATAPLRDYIKRLRSKKREKKDATEWGRNRRKGERSQDRMSYAKNGPNDGNDADEKNDSTDNSRDDNFGICIDREKSAMEKYQLNVMLYFLYDYNERDIYQRLLNNELKYKDILCLKRMFGRNFEEKIVASCGCITVSKKKLMYLHQQNKRFPNYKYKDINLKKVIPSSNDHIKLIDHISLTNSLPKVSFFFYMSHELMHTYIWLTEIKKSKYFESVYLIVKKLHYSSFPVEDKKEYAQVHKNLSFFLSPELEEAICIYVSIELMQHVQKRKKNRYNYESELVNYYIEKHKCSKSSMYGANYRSFKKTMRNYKIMDVMGIINDIYCTKLYPLVTLNLLEAVISRIGPKQ
ncbi:hypothetical protein, conserved [Plasmodium ovale wallikeri]|uniref:Uncharacterized protein n=1 Tax=Plasmodium ovale wallikeri TaxID=864142 RepID=A0A1A8ZBN5_PLAOA|nr:hypothetical protein, conserved [Plasmodium ovale wallikeri]